ncbi:unnamed protein product [Schistosoma bovis]|nr:unnamed protein product [Schistosoma bovis]
MRNPIPNVTGSHQMTWKELAEADDLASALTVDPYLGFTTHKMTDMKLRIPDRIKRKFRDIICNFQKHKCYDAAYNQLIADPNIVKRPWSVDPRFKEHVNRYLLLFDDRSGIEIRPCWRYASENHMGAAIFATRDWAKGSRISTLVGCIAELKHHEEAAFLKHHKNDFSVMYSSRKNCSQLWLGPAAYVNHDCHPNCEFTINCDVDARMSLEAKTDIKCGDEIFIYYGTHFFDTNNRACECFTCELLGRGYFSKFTQTIDSSTVSNQKLIPNIVNGQENYTRNIASYHNARYNPNVRSHVLLDKMNLLPDNTLSACNDAQNAKQLSLDFFLEKGSSTGLACKALPNAYALRHTGSRLNRVKARLFAAKVASINRSFGVNSQENRKPKIKSSYEKCKLRMTISNIIPSLKRNKSKSNPHAIGKKKLIKSVAAVKSRQILSDAQAKDNFTSRRNIGNLSDHSIVCDGISWQESDGTSSGLGRSVNNDSSGSNSPLPPDLDRMSSTSPNNSFSETIVVTPDLKSSYYLESLVQKCTDNRNMKRKSCSISAESSIPIISPLRITAENELTKNVEPILGRLMHETKCSSDLKNPLTTNYIFNQSTTSEHSRRRLTNYDARLIAEASLLTPISKQRQRKPPSYPDSVEYVSFKNTVRSKTRSIKCGNKDELLNDKSQNNNGHDVEDANDDSKSFYTKYNPQLGLSFVGNKYVAASGTQYYAMPDQCTDIESFSEELIPPLLTSPSKLHTTSSFTLSDSSHDVGPPSIYSTAEADDRSELISIDSELTEPNLDTDSSCDYHISNTPIIPFGLYNKSITNDKKSSLMSAEHILIDHDYSLPAYDAECTLVSDPILNTKINNQDHRQISEKNSLQNYNINNNNDKNFNAYLPEVVRTPPPPLLQPETQSSIFELYARDSPRKIKNDFLPNSSHIPSVSYAHNSWQSRTSDTKDIWHPDLLFSDSSSPDSRRLTVTLKRVGPKHYQISQPSRLFID